jgi:hypothetical protein
MIPPSPLKNTFLTKWAQHEEEITWQDFHEFLLHLINNRVNFLCEACQRYSDAKQKSEQSVRGFAT